jgi:antitoxin (DNA-binding transcriptional repressor) of toxin-antitoxin stability system
MSERAVAERQDVMYTKSVHMKASILDLRRRMPDVLRALERNEPVTLLYRGKPKGMLLSLRSATRAVRGNPAFGLWKDRDDLKDVGRYVRSLRDRRRAF